MSTIQIEDHILGNNASSLTLIQYGDYECPTCFRAHGLVERVIENYTPNICFIFRHFPLSKQHPMAMMAAQAAEFAAQQGKFWEMHNLLYTRQCPLNLEALQAMAKQLGLSQDAQKAAMEQNLFHQKITRDFETGILCGVYALPAFFINDKLYKGDLAHLGAHLNS